MEIFPRDCEPGHPASPWQQWTNLAVLGLSAGAFLCSEAGGEKAVVCVDFLLSCLEKKLSALEADLLHSGFTVVLFFVHVCAMHMCVSVYGGQRTASGGILLQVLYRPCVLFVSFGDKVSHRIWSSLIPIRLTEQ